MRKWEIIIFAMFSIGSTVCRCSRPRLIMPAPGALRHGATPMEGAIYAETIPFNETRDYVKKVLANAMFYQAQLGLPYVALRERLGVVTPRGTGALSEVAAIPPGDRPKEAP